VDWSYDLLSQAERALFNRLSVFVGGWTLEAAEIVCAGEAVQRDEVVHLLTRLVDRSLVVAEERSGAMRYRLLETLRQYGAERLSHTGEAMQLRDRHRDWCVALAELGERDIWRADQLACIQRLEREHDNLRAALGWTLTGAGDPEPGLRIAAAMVRFWDVHGDLREGTRWLTDLLSLSSVPRETPGWAKALTARGYLAVIRGDLAEAIADLNAAIVFGAAWPTRAVWPWRCSSAAWRLPGPGRTWPARSRSSRRACCLPDNADRAGQPTSACTVWAKPRASLATWTGPKPCSASRCH
jgi:hypothetical protein